jgi:MFS family permease
MAANHSSWLDHTVLGVGLTSLLSDWSHEAATAILPAFLATIGAGPAWLGAIEGAADGLSSVAKLTAGHYTDRLRRRKPLVLAGYVVTSFATASFAFATHAAHVLIARVIARLGRGVRAPARKTLLAASVPPGAYGRAFGLERLMDTLGAIAGPLSALWLLRHTAHDCRRIFWWTLLPGLLAVFCFWLLVRERRFTPAAARSFWKGLGALPARFHYFLLAVGIFGAGDFSHTLLILYAARQLAPQMGSARAATAAIGLYALHNAFYAGSAYLSGWLGDRTHRRDLILAAGYALAGLTALLLSLGSHHIWLLAVVFLFSGVFVGTEEALEDSLAAEIVPREQHGMAFGTLAAVNAAGDFVSSFLIGTLWTVFSVGAAFSASAALFFIGAGFIASLGLSSTFPSGPS